MAESSQHQLGESSQTVTVTEGQHETEAIQEIAAVRLKLSKPQKDKKVNWTNETVDNEHMDKKKSKCCCIYKKPHSFDSSSDEEDLDCDNCRGHVEKRVHKTDPPPEST